MSLVKPFSGAPLDLTVKIRPGAPLEAAVGKDAIRMMTKPDGTIHLGIGGTLAAPAFAFR